MQWPVKTDQVGLRVLGSQILTAAGPVVSQAVGNDLTMTTGAAGNVAIAYKQTFQRGSVAGYTTEVDVGDASYGVTKKAETASSNTGIRSISIDNGGTAAAGTLHALHAGWDSLFTGYNLLHPYDIKTSQSGSRLMGFVFDDGGAALTEGKYRGAYTTGGTGVYNITFTNPYASDNVIVLATAMHASACRAINIESVSAESIQLSTWTAAGSASGTAFHCLVLGWNHQGISWGRRSILQSPQPKARLHALNIVTSGGTPSINLGTGVATITDTGTGRYTLTWRKPFGRAPVVIVTGDNLRACLRGAPTTTGCEINLYNAAGDTLTDGDAHVLVYGSDQAVQL